MRLSREEAVALFDLPLGELGERALALKRQKSGEEVFYNKNIHIEPTNICRFHCVFCSYRRDEGEEGVWYHSLDEVEAIARERVGSGITEVHIVGGVHPKHDLDYYCEMIRRVKKVLPDVAVKAYTAVELYYIIKQSGVGLQEGLQKLIDSGMDAIPGGGAEIFDETVRRRICPDKPNAQEWLETHKVAHQLGIRTNATILYGHIETIEQRIDHLFRLRDLQDLTGGFDAFIPLKFKRENNKLGEGIEEVSIVEDMKMFAVSRLVLDNFDHIKAYWAMLGVDATQMALAFGADDVDGTIGDTTKIYTMAGQKQKPTLDENELREMIAKAGFVPVERDTHYNVIRY